MLPRRLAGFWGRVQARPSPWSHAHCCARGAAGRHPCARRSPLWLPGSWGGRGQARPQHVPLGKSWKIGAAPIPAPLPWQILVSGDRKQRIRERSAAACVPARVGAHGWLGALLSYVPQRGNLGGSLPASPVTSVGGTEPFPLLLTLSRSISAFSKWSILGPGPSPASPFRLQQGSEPGWDFGVKQREPAPHPCTTLLPVQQHLSPIKSPFQHLGTNSLLQHTAAPVPNRSG